jgi:hypothetical protein
MALFPLLKHSSCSSGEIVSTYPRVSVRLSGLLSSCSRSSSSRSPRARSASSTSSCCTSCRRARLKLTAYSSSFALFFGSLASSALMPFLSRWTWMKSSSSPASIQSRNFFRFNSRSDFLDLLQLFLLMLMFLLPSLIFQTLPQSVHCGNE